MATVTGCTGGCRYPDIYLQYLYYLLSIISTLSRTRAKSGTPYNDQLSKTETAGLSTSTRDQEQRVRPAVISTVYLCLVDIIYTARAYPHVYLVFLFDAGYPLNFSD